MGDAMGIKAAPEVKDESSAADAEEAADQGPADYKANAGFAKHMKVLR
jgi:hypothetical protein